MSPGHHHHTERDRETMSGTARRLTLALLIPAVVLTAIGMVLLWPQDPPQTPTGGETVRAMGTVLAVTPEACPENPELPEAPEGEAATGVPAPVCGTVAVRITDGAGAGSQVATEIPAGPGAVTVSSGDEVVLLQISDEPGGEPTYSIVDHQRSTGLWLLGAAFALAVIAFGRWRGVTALGGLGITFAVLLLFIVPAILDGRSPVLVAVVGAAAIMLTVLYLTHGFTMTTTVAVAGTLASLSITAVLSALSIAVTHLSGIADEATSYLNITQGDVNMRGLLLAGIVIGSLGVLDDVTVTQSATVTELARANPAYGFRQLYGAATRVGRAHIASVINTIVLAYAGASLPLMLLFAAGNTPVGELLTTELIAQELIRSMVGTIGLVSAVPITTALAALLATRWDPGGAAVEAAPVTATGPATGGVAGPAAAPAEVPRQTEALGATPQPPPTPAGTPWQDPSPPEDPWAAFVDRHPDGPR
ncbi:YibE/F family protein [Plantactinospora sp. GCM10030261]|uniref:YibE/F family protein n=1 Tax=Plantactinospora sp. GCM10030261 TaxID=3273420 RepID=UPI00360D112D